MSWHTLILWQCIQGTFKPNGTESTKAWFFFFSSYWWKECCMEARHLRSTPESASNQQRDLEKPVFSLGKLCKMGLGFQWWVMSSLSAKGCLCSRQDPDFLSRLGIRKMSLPVIAQLGPQFLKNTLLCKKVSG